MAKGGGRREKGQTEAKRRNSAENKGIIRIEL